MNKVVYVALAAFALWSCGNNNRNNNDNNIDTPVPPVVGDVKEDIDDYYQDSPDDTFEYSGTYKGTLPCADCEGIETIVRLGDISNGDASYTVTTTYLGGKSDGKPFVQKGNFRWDYDDDKGTYVVLEGLEDGPRRFLVTDDSLIQLDMDGNIITGTNAQHYILKKE